MNIFILDNDVKNCARYHCDIHVPKMILEGVQMVCTAHHFYEQTDGIHYKPTHMNHPCSVWVRASYNNYIWMYYLINNLNSEWMSRFNHRTAHKSWAMLRSAHSLSPNLFPIRSLTPFAQVMPQIYRNPKDAVMAYRNYYMYEKRGIAKWRNVKPWWWIDVEDLRYSTEGGNV